MPDDLNGSVTAEAHAGRVRITTRYTRADGKQDGLAADLDADATAALLTEIRDAIVAIDEADRHGRAAAPGGEA